MRKKLILTGLSALAVLTLASCSSEPKTEGSISYQEVNPNYTYTDAPAAVSYAENLGNVDIYINYNGESGITYRGTSWNNVVDGMTYTQGSLLPTWSRIQELTKTNIREASGYRAANLDNAYTSIATAGYKSETDSSRVIDLFYNSVSNLRTAGNAGGLLDLTNEITESNMPYLYAYLEANPAIKKAITTSGKIYYAPYLDGENEVEKTFIVDTTMVKKVLSEAANGDETISGKGAAANTLQEVKYSPFITEESDSVSISVNGELQNKPIANVENIIAQQNTLLANGATGKQLAQQLVTYIKAKYSFYGDNVWELYIGENAAYNTDELIALMRVIKANPGLLTGDTNKEIEIFMPRGESSESIDSVLDLLQLFGVQGLDAENGNFYFSADGKLNAFETTSAAYDGLDILSALYDEGLILENFYASEATRQANRYLDQYFKKSTTKEVYGFMMYDDPSIITTANDEFEGLGTKSESRSNYAKELEIKGIYSILPPRTYWATTGNSSQYPLKNRDGKTLARYYESNRSLQNTSWAIPANTDNKEAALRIMDFMYSPLGQLIQNYGPEAYWEKTQVVNNMTAQTELNAIVSYKTKLELVCSNLDFWSFMRGYLGATHGIGHIRLGGLNLQATNYYGQIGLRNVQNAIAAGALYHATNSETYSWNVSVPTQFSTSVTDVHNQWDGISGFWATNKINKNEGWVNVVVSGFGTDKSKIEIKTLKNATKISYADMLKQRDAYNKYCLREYANSLGEDCIPMYVKTTI